MILSPLPKAGQEDDAMLPPMGQTDNAVPTSANDLITGSACRRISAHTNPRVREEAETSQLTGKLVLLLVVNKGLAPL